MDKLVVLLFLCFGSVHCSRSHFRGGTMSYSKSSPNGVDFYIRLAYRRSQVFCDDARITNKQLVSSRDESWRFTRNTTYGYTDTSIGHMSIHCSNFNVNEDWVEGYNNFTFSGSQYDKSYEMSISGGGWIKALTYSNSQHNIQLLTRINVLNNSSPVSSIPLTIYVTNASVIKIPIHDDDGDIVRCRNASHQECYAGICTYFPYGMIDEAACTITYDGSGSEGGLYPISLKLEDYPPGTTQFHSSKSKSSVDLQFIIRISKADDVCPAYKELNSLDRSRYVRASQYIRCDNGLSGWYRFTGLAGSQIATSCVPKNHCGTYEPGWMDGSHPTPAEGIVTRKVCYHASYRCCNWYNMIRVKNCGSFYVYELNGTPYNYCHMGYCGNGTGEAPTTQMPTTDGCSAYKELNSTDRSRYERASQYLCDYGLSKGWYRFTGSAGSQIATSCVPLYRCGTIAPGWMNGSHPTTAEGIVTRKVCYNFASCCIWNNMIRVENCGSFYVYELNGTPNCNLRYCGSNGTVEAPTTQMPTTAMDGGCSSSPCRNGGTCMGVSYGLLYYCYCPNGYTGKQCETNLKTSVTCGEDYMEITLQRQYFPNTDYRNLHLKSTSCRASVTWYTISLRTDLDGCGTTYTETNETIEFWNEVNDDQRYKSGDPSAITREGLIVLPFYCKYSRRQLVSTSFRPSKTIIHASEGNFGNFTFTMNLYKSSQYQRPYWPFDYPVAVSLNDALWIQFEVKDTKADLVVFAESCLATTSINPNSLPKYVLLEQGCVRDPTMVYSHNPKSRVQRFTIKSFRFVYANNALVYLHCELMVCHRNSTKSRCSRGCIRSRRRREAAEYEDSSLVYDLSVGPIKGDGTTIKNAEQANGDAQKANVGMVSGLVVVCGLVVILVAVLVIMKLRGKFPSLLRATYTNSTPPIAMDVTVNSYEQNDVDLDEQQMDVEI